MQMPVFWAEIAPLLPIVPAKVAVSVKALSETKKPTAFVDVIVPRLVMLPIKSATPTVEILNPANFAHNAPPLTVVPVKLPVLRP